MFTDIGYAHIEVPCMSFTKDAAEQALIAAGLTWHINDISKLDEKGIAVLIDKITNNKVSPKIMEALKCSFVFRDISRICLARLTRDQCEAINSESQATPTFDENMELKSRHVERRTTIPLNIALDPKLLEEYQTILATIEEFQVKLEDANFAWAPDIRYIGTMGTQISIFMQFNARQFVATCNRRFINSINDEDNYAYRKALHSLRTEVENARRIGTITELTYQLWNRVIADCDPRVDFSDELFGKQFDRGVPFRGDVDVNIYTREQSAWAFELVRMRHEEPHLLLKGEADMIDKWISSPGRLADYAKSLRE